LQNLTGTRMNHVPYNGAAPAIGDLLPGRIQVWIGAANSLLPHIRDGKLRLLATAADRRFGAMPDAPTVAEAGVPGYALYPWLGLFVPGRTPADVVAKINGEVSRILNSPESRARLVPQGIDISTGSPAELKAVISADYAQWGKVMGDAGIKGE